MKLAGDDCRAEHLSIDTIKGYKTPAVSGDLVLPLIASDVTE